MKIKLRKEQQPAADQEWEVAPEEDVVLEHGAKPAPATNTPALVSLIFGILAWTFLPLIGAVVAVVAGHKGRKKAQDGAPRGGMALAGLILGYVALVLTVLTMVAFFIMGGAMLAVLKSAESTQPIEVVQTVPTNEPAAGTPRQADAAMDVLIQAKMQVATALQQGVALNEINDVLPLNEAQQAFWAQVRIQQGTVMATPQGSDEDHALVLLSIPNGDQLQWVCAGEVPDAVKSICQ